MPAATGCRVLLGLAHCCRLLTALPAQQQSCCRTIAPLHRLELAHVQVAGLSDKLYSARMRRPVPATMTVSQAHLRTGSVLLPAALATCVPRAPTACCIFALSGHYTGISHLQLSDGCSTLQPLHELSHGVQHEGDGFHHRTTSLPEHSQPSVSGRNNISRRRQSSSSSHQQCSGSGNGIANQCSSDLNQDPATEDAHGYEETWDLPDDEYTPFPSNCPTNSEAERLSSSELFKRSRSYLGMQSSNERWRTLSQVC